MRRLQPGKNNLITAARTNGTNRTNRTSGSNGGGGGGGGVPASIPENIIQMAAELKTDRARPSPRKIKPRLGYTAALLQRLGIQRAARDRALAIYNGVSCGTQLVARCWELIT